MTRLSTRHSRREIEHPRDLVIDLVQTFAKLREAVVNNDLAAAYDLCDELEKPISYLCESSRLPGSDLNFVKKRWKGMYRRRPRLEESEPDEET